LPAAHDFTTLALLACSVHKHGIRRALTVGRRADHAAGAFWPIFAHLGCIIPDLIARTLTVRRRTDCGWRAWVVAILVDLDRALRAYPLAVRRRAGHPRSAVDGAAESLAEGGAFWAAIRRRTIWPVRGAEAFAGLAARAVLVRLVELDVALVALALLQSNGLEAAVALSVALPFVSASFLSASP